jgi:heptosyltransferase I
MANILFVKTSSLGDVVHHMPALAEARAHRPDAKFSWVVEEGFAPLARLHPGIDEVIPVATRRWRSQPLSAATWSEIATLRRKLRGPFDLVVDTQGLIRSALIAKLAKGTRHGYDASSIREPFAARFYDVTHQVSREQHAVARNRALTAQALGYAPGEIIDYGLPRGAPSGAPHAVLLHGTSRAEKEWSEANWIALGQALHQRGLRVLLPWGSDAERARSERLSRAIAGSEVLARQPLDQTAKVIAGASLVVGVDTGLLHLAAACTVPLVGIYVATEPGRTGPVGAGKIEVVGGKNASPGADQVIAAAERALR